MNKKIFITTPIYYPNANLHIGHLYTTTIADIFSKHKKMEGYETFFITGSDEHGQKIQEAAKKNGSDPYEYVSKIVDSFKDLWKLAGINYDLFIRTTDKEHEQYVIDIFHKLEKKGFIYKGNYEGNYCRSCESYYTNTQLEKGNCPSCGRKTQILSEETYFLKVSKFQGWIKEQLTNEKILLPPHRNNELLNNFLNDNLEDLSITRKTLTWGIKPKEDEEHVIYVWFDALLNYLSAFQYKDSKFSIDEVWKGETEILQIVGKEITRFHCIYWPVILEMLNYKKPFVYAHGWLLVNNEKMSKSKGNSVDPIKYINEFGKDIIRFFLANNIVFGEDGRIDYKLVKELKNSIIINKYANLFSRTSAMVKKYFDGIVPASLYTDDNIKEIKLRVKQLEQDYFKLMNQYKISKATKKLINIMEELNKFIDITQPWKQKGSQLEAIISILVVNIYRVSVLIHPYMSETAEKIIRSYGEEIPSLYKDMKNTLEGNKIEVIEHLYNR